MKFVVIKSNIASTTATTILRITEVFFVPLLLATIGKQTTANVYAKFEQQKEMESTRSCSGLLITTGNNDNSDANTGGGAMVIE